MGSQATTILLVLLWLTVIGAVYLLVLRATRMHRVRERLAEEHRAAFEPEVVPIPDERMSWLQRWLFLAGFRRPEGPLLFLTLAFVAIVVGFLGAWTLRQSPVVAQGLTWLHGLPGGVGAMFSPVIVLAPWVLFLVIALLPWLHVRRARRRRVQEIEEDLPLTLQILATLARAGLGFDASLVRVLESSDPTRVLPEELESFRRELLSGVPRVHAYRRLARRMEVPSVSVFVSAMVHAEQVGGGLSGVLEHQADDVQSRRRERALVQAQGLPVKLVFPLVLCFLPAIFVWTLGPAFYQFLQVIDGVMRQSGQPG